MPRTSSSEGPPSHAWFRHPLTWVLVASGLIKVVTLIGNSVSLGYADSTAYVSMAQGADGIGVSPPGYPLFLRFVHLFSSSTDLLLLVQHALVLAGAGAVYVTARDLRCGVTTSTLAAAVFALCGNLLGAAQGLLTESLFTVLAAVAGACAVRASRVATLRTPVRPTLALGVVAGLAISVRVVGAPLLLVLGALVLIAVATWRARAVTAGVLAGSTLATIVGVALLAGTSAGLPGGGGVSSSGWMLYGRVAQFADCPATYAPAAVRKFCPKEPEAVRPGPDYWHSYGGPAFETFGGKPAGNAQLQEFAVSVIEHQPIDYLRAAIVDMARFAIPNFGRERPYSGGGWDELELDRPLNPEAAQYNRTALSKWFSPWTPRASNLQLVARYQEAATITAGGWFILMLGAALAPFAARRGWRISTLIVSLGGFALMFAATALNMYVARYALPALGLLLPATAVALEGLARRISREEREGDAGVGDAASDHAPTADATPSVADETRVAPAAV